MDARVYADSGKLDHVALALAIEAEAGALAFGQGVTPRAVMPATWREWLTKYAPQTFTGSFSDFHIEFWDWYWAITKKRLAGLPLTDEEMVFLAIWARGQGKSSNVEWAAITEGAWIGKGYVLYVSGTQRQARDHVLSIRERIETENVAVAFPHLGQPKVGKYGNQYGWSQDVLITDGGWAIRPLGLDEGIRGGKIGETRPTLIILDDVDTHDDSPLVVENKLAAISRSIIPAGGKNTIILGAQNLIHRNSVFNQILTRRTGVLGRRRVSGPFQAFKDIQIETRSTPDGPRNMITKGVPTWPDMDLDACQKFLDDSGPAAFLAEYQHDFSAIEERRVISEYDERLHVITWSQFKEVFGVRYIPQHWERACGLDIGYTEGHLSAWTWIATSAANSKAPGLRFRYRGMTFTEPLLDDMADAVVLGMKPDPDAGRYFDELPLIQTWRASHEQKGARDTLRAKHNLPFIAGKSGKHDGIEQWQHYLRRDKTKPHPFIADEEITEGVYRLGRPHFFDVVDDDQLISPRDDRGLKTHREQVLAWRYRKIKLTDTGLQDEQPVKAFEDTCDSTRFITAEWGPEPTPLTEAEKTELGLPDGLQRENLNNRPPGFQRDIGEFMREVKLAERKKEQKQVGDNWTAEIVDPSDDPWDGAYKDPVW